jgi:hypothetical protein
MAKESGNLSEHKQHLVDKFGPETADAIHNLSKEALPKKQAKPKKAAKKSRLKK